MTRERERAATEFRRMLKWIAVAGLAMVAGSLVYLHLMDAWSLHAVIATVLGVFVSVLLGCGLFALAFFSDKSGHDERVGRAANPLKPEDKTDETALPAERPENGSNAP